MSHTDRHTPWPRHAPVAPMAIARAGFGLGLALSIVGNVADARHSILAMAIGGVWPLLLMIAFEILIRTVWPSGRWWRWPPITGLLLVAAVSGFMSYRHLMSLLGRIGEDRYGASVGPVAFDGLMVIAAWAMLAMTRAAPAQTSTDTDAAPKPARAVQRKSAARKPRPKPNTRPTPRQTPRGPLGSVPLPPAPEQLPAWAIPAAQTVLARDGKINSHTWQQQVRADGATCSNPTRARLWPTVKIHIEATKRESA